MNKIDGGVLSTKGFRGGMTTMGIKASGKPDLALLWSESPAKIAALFTVNSVQAAPVQLSKKHCADHDVRAIVVNSGNANCMTGEAGKQHAQTMADDTAVLLNIKPEQVLVASTGIIGKPVPID
jgi:glutamate N-acetyltransferase/amino-acid N-acetyltransferase